LCIGVDARAQNWNFDARAIALGGQSTSNPAAGMVSEQRPYRAIVLPFGLFQVLGDFDIFDPSSDKFDLVRTIEYSASPIHYVVGRGTTDTGEAFINDIRNGELSRDLNRYRGFVPANEIRAEGLASPSWGKTFKIREGAGGTFHAVRIGAGPYLSMRNDAAIDPELTAFLASATPVSIPNRHFTMADTTQAQTALAITGGYRGRLAWPSGGSSEIDGLYVAVDYNYLHGFGLENADMNVRIDTDGSGLVTLSPATIPILIDRRDTSKGSGMAVDVGVAGVIDRWELGFGANGLGNHINWHDTEQTSYTLTSLAAGNGDFIESPTTIIGDTRIELPVDYRGNLAYRTDLYSLVTEVGHGFGGTSFHGGLEMRFPRIEVRGGARYTNETWNPTGGVGFNFSKRVSLDVAGFGTSANIERKRQLAIAASIRLNHVE
jgi:hypothetical protein